MFTLGLCAAAMMPPVPITTEEKIDLQQVRGPVSVYRFALLAFALVGLFAAFNAMPPSAEAAGVSGQLEAWGLEFGTAPGELINPHQFGVDPVDGSAYIVNYPPEHPEEARIDKYSAAGSFEGSVAVSLVPEQSGAALKRLVGIAVDDSRKRFYLVQNEFGLDTTTGLEAAVATKVLAYSTELSSPGHLGQPVQTFTLPAANGPDTILWATEIHVDPKTHDLVIAGTSATDHPILQRISASGTLGARYEETGSHLMVGGAGEAFFAFDISGDGTTYIVANSTGSSEHPSIEGFTLAPEFTASSSLEALPGFVGAGTNETAVPGRGWNTESFSFLVAPSNVLGEAFGPQLAVVTKPGGEEVLYWKTGSFENVRQQVRIHGYSLKQGSVASFGGGPNDASGHDCSIQSEGAAIAPTTGGDLLVLEPGQEVEGSGTPQWFPTVLRFGAGSLGVGGSQCPNPAPLIKVKDGSNPDVGTVAAGTQVALDASGSELGTLTPSEYIWKITKQGGSTETIPVTGTPPSAEKSHVFAEAGTYTIQLVLKTTANLPTIGNSFAAEPKTLTVTPGATGPVVTGLSPNHGAPAGGETVEITGTGLAGATKVEFGSAIVDAPFAEDTATKIKLDAPACTDGEVVHVKVTTAEGTSVPGAADQFTCAAQTPAPAVTAISPKQGPAVGGTVVTITGTDLASPTEVKFGTVGATNVTAVSATEVKATSPAGTGKVHVVVVTGGGSSAAGAADEFTYEAVPTHSLTITKVGSGSGSITCNGSLCQTAYPVGTPVVLHATADPGSTFVGWREGGGCSGTADCTVVLNANTSIVAAFNTVPPDTGNQPGNNTPPSTNNNPPPGNGTPPPGGGSKPKTPAELLKEKQQKALQKCKKLHGKAKAQCVKKAKQIGKPKPKAKKS